MRPLSTDKELLFQVWDVETTMNDPDSGHSASNPFHPDNRIVLLGVGVMLDDESFITEVLPGNDTKCNVNTEGTHDMLVGHNIKFDLHYMRPLMGEEGCKELYNKCPIWDTQIAAYILSGQRDKITSLDDLCRLYSVPTKKGAGHAAITTMFDKGLGADHADPDELVSYLEHDLESTGRVALAQMKEATDQQFNLIIQMGEALKAVQECEWNGMAVNKEAVETIQIELILQTITTQNDALEKFKEIHPDAIEFLKWKPDALGSNQVISSVLFGGRIEYVAKEEDGLFKSGKKKGQVRMKNVPKTIKFPGYLVPTGITEATKVRTKAGDIVYKVDEDVLDKIEGLPELPLRVGEMFHSLLKVKKFIKANSTYYENFLDMEINGIIHHTLHQCITATGRLSSAKPNMQNVPANTDNPLLHVKSVIHSRYEDGVIVEIDFKQLEVCTLAWLTQDPQLIADIREGRDVHNEVGRQCGLDMSDKQRRRDVKAIVFAMIYGAGVNGIAKSSGLPRPLVKDVIGAFYERYSTVQGFYKHLTKAVEEKGARVDLITRGPAGPEHLFEMVSPTGRTYMFHQDPFRPGPKYTQLRNYPVQGTATADIVPMVMAEVANVLRNMDETHKVHLITQTHDSVTLDCYNEDDAKHAVRELQYKVFRNIEDLINEKFPGIEWNIPLTIEVEIGPDWGSMKPLDMELHP